MALMACLSGVMNDDEPVYYVSPVSANQKVGKDCQALIWILAESLGFQPNFVGC